MNYLWARKNTAFLDTNCGRSEMAPTIPQGKLKKKYLSRIYGLPKTHKAEIVHFTGLTTDE